MPGSTSCSARGCSTTRCSRSASSTSRWCGLRPTPRSSSASSIRICRSWCCRSTPAWRKWTSRCSKPRPISARRAGRRSGWSPCRCRRPASSPARCCASSRSPASSSFPICSAARTLMIGQTLWTEFFQNKDWPVASAVAIALLVILLAPILIYQHLQMRALEGGRLMRSGLVLRSTSTSVALGLAFLYLPIAILVIYSFNASRLVTVWGGWSTRWYVALLHDQRHARRRLDQPADRRALGDGGERARHAGRGGAGPRRALPRAHAVLRHGLCAAGDARGHHRAVAAAAVRRAQRSTAASGR